MERLLIPTKARPFTGPLFRHYPAMRAHPMTIRVASHWAPEIDAPAAFGIINLPQYPAPSPDVMGAGAGATSP